MNKHDFTIVNGDTDSIMFCKKDQSKFTEEEQNQLIDEINSLLPTHIKMANDGYYKSVLIVKAKNYALFDGKSTKIKGSALKATTKEKALQNFIKDIIDYLLKGKKDRIFYLYENIARDIKMGISDISQWASKKTITKKILEPERTNERKVLTALNGRKMQEGDKVYMFFKENNELCMVEDYKGDYSKSKLLGKLFNTIKVFKNVLDIDMIPNYSKKGNNDLLDNL